MTVSNLELHGIDAPLEEEIYLRAGPFEAVFEPARAYLRRVRINGVEAVRNVYVHVRRTDWFTILPAVTMLDHKVGTDHFELTWKAVHRLDEIEFEWNGALVGNPSGIHYTCEGIAVREFGTNRTSLCVLIPREFSGLKADLEHTGGSRSQVALPTTISPTQPLRGMRSITVGPAKLTFEGEAFDAEDQRNWTDASFKAYPVTPPPYTLAKGERLSQGLRIEAVDWTDPRPRIEVGPGRPTQPLLGATVADDHDDLGGLAVDFLRVELPEDAGKARHLLDHARSAGVPIKIVVPKGAPIPELHGTETLIAVDAPNRPLGSASVWLEAGSFDSFNMGRHEAAGFDGVEVSGTPQIHTFDERSILENAATLGDVVLSLASICPAASERSLNIRLKLDGPDPRLHSLFGALWILRCYASLCGPYLTHLTVGSASALRYPPIAALMKELTAQRPGSAACDGELIILKRSPMLVGNLIREPKCVHFDWPVERAEILTPTGWQACHFPSGSILDPYRIVRVKLQEGKGA